MKARISLWIITLITVACGAAIYIFHCSRFLLEDSSLTAFGTALLLLGIPFGASAIISYQFDAEIGSVELWKILLGITIALPIAGIVIVENGLAQAWEIDPIWIVDAQFALPLVINYLFTLWAIFHDQHKHNRYHRRPPAPPTPPSPPSTTTTTETETNAYGLPTGLPF